MPMVAERILDLLRGRDALDDDQIASRLGIIRQHVNQAAHRLEKQGLLVRSQGPLGKVVNQLSSGARTPAMPQGPAAPSPLSPAGEGPHDWQSFKTQARRYLSDLWGVDLQPGTVHVAGRCRGSSTS